MKYLVLKYPDDTYVGVDNHSGGYPYSTTSLGDAWILPNPPKLKKYNGIVMNRYMEMFKHENFRLFEVEVIEKEVKLESEKL